jgi:hypothetical protein
MKSSTQLPSLGSFTFIAWFNNLTPAAHSEFIGIGNGSGNLVSNKGGIVASLYFARTTISGYIYDSFNFTISNGTTLSTLTIPANITQVPSTQDIMVVGTYINTNNQANNNEMILTSSLQGPGWRTEHTKGAVLIQPNTDNLHYYLRSNASGSTAICNFRRWDYFNTPLVGNNLTYMYSQGAKSLNW